MLSVATQNNISLQEEYTNHRELIVEVQQQCLKDIELLKFEQKTDHNDAVEYINDKDAEFAKEETIAKLLNTIQWRAEKKISRMTYQSVTPEFFENGFSFFHKQDLIGRPVAIIQMRHFPKFSDKTKNLSDFMQPFACLVMEMARQITRDKTKENEDKGAKPSLVSQISIVIDIAKAPFVPVDTHLVQALKNITNERFPGFIGSVYIVNFGWMYQGIWQVVKLVLSDRAKARVNFVSSQELKQIISEKNLVKALGGEDEYIWSLGSDPILDLYATETRFTPPSPTIDTRLSRSTSLSSMDSSLFFDAPEYILNYQSPTFVNSTIASVPSSVYATPGSLTPINSYSRRLQTTRTSEPRYFLNGFHMGDNTFLSSFLGTNNRRPVNALSNELTDRLNQLLLEQDGLIDEAELFMIKDNKTAHFPHMLPSDHPHSIYFTSPLRHQLARAEQRMVRMTRKVFRMSFAYKGAVYWLLLYVFLRGPVEHTLKKSLAKLFVGSKEQITYATVGVTATIAAALSSTFSNSLDSRNKRLHG
ncbi:CRAL-TRIO domain-containing protein [Sporodiniella umbellata]|nr:CRAL-TRIO domain-containing protein [Sporodiniella umbellata]